MKFFHFFKFFLLKNYLAYYGLTFRIFIPLLAKKKDIIINNSSDILIEGYPRSGNTFCRVAFLLSQGKKVKVASHRHERGHIILAIKLRKPVIVLIRDPLNTISSFVIREKVNISFAFNYYIKFYKGLIPYLNDILLIDFNDLIKDFNQIIYKINKKFNTNFTILKKDYTFYKEVIRKEIEKGEKHDSGKNVIRITHIAYPNKKRKKIKEVIIHKILSNKKYNKKLREAELLYKKLLKLTKE